MRTALHMVKLMIIHHMVQILINSNRFFLLPVLRLVFGEFQFLFVFFILFK